MKRQKTIVKTHISSFDYRESQYCLDFSDTCAEEKNKQNMPAESVHQAMWCGPLWEDTCSTQRLQSALWKPLWGKKGPDPGLALKAVTITAVHGLPLALLTVPWNGPQEQCKPPKNRPLTVSQQCSLCVKIVKAGPFLNWFCLSFEPQLWTNKAGLKVCIMVS